MTYIIATLVAMIGSILIVTIAPLFYGLVDMAVRGVKGEPIDYKDVFSGFDHFVRSWGFAIVAAVLLLVGYMLLIIPGIILSILLLYAFPLLVIRGYSGVDAIKESIEDWKKQFPGYGNHLHHSLDNQCHRQLCSYWFTDYYSDCCDRICGSHISYDRK